MEKIATATIKFEFDLDELKEEYPHLSEEQIKEYIKETTVEDLSSYSEEELSELITVTFK